MDIESLPSRNQINKLITNNALITEEEFNEIYEQLYLKGDAWGIGLDIFDRLIDIVYEDEEEQRHWKAIFARTFEEDVSIKDCVVLEIGAVKRQVRITLRMLIGEMRNE